MTLRNRLARRPYAGLVLVAAAIAGSAVVAAAAQKPAAPAAIAAGRTLYQAKCSVCHGVNGRAQVQAMANAADLTRPEWFKRGSSDAAIFASVQNGVGNGMPPFKGDLSPADTNKVIAYIRSLKAPAKGK
jgi:mono/diheme cytochrome c family protein